ncbi:response regulator transcription factor [Paenibacillus thalictri]|uniref:Response regulator n=1 Tax=Paenibacillus thalictri TaxID=2527873 RepID=A0A4Q9DLY9_9BACL|nr:helix-turn-helix domain-containing protein [Paenibacillus thalictri]TBL73965.1 response regulator [Paenibacillus thalictri]
MYKVMLVDDDYPVLELLSGAIDWQKHDMRLIGVHEDGASALEASGEEMPDILITDIGMPKLNGLELIKELKERKPGLRAAVLSCHNEFHYAQQAVKLHVQDYLLKDTFDPADLEKLLVQFKASLEHEQKLDMEQTKLLSIVDRSKEMMKEKFIRHTIHEPIWDRSKWEAEAGAFGLSLDGSVCLPIMGFITDYKKAVLRFGTEETLGFAVTNVILEVLAKTGINTVHSNYGTKLSFILPLFTPTLKVNPYEQTSALIGVIQKEIHRTLKISTSYLIGGVCGTPEELKAGLKGLLDSKTQCFYMDEGTIARKAVSAAGKGDIFAKYDQASEQLRELITDKNETELMQAVKRWMGHVKEQVCPPEIAKDWVLKLLLDLKLKLQALQYFRPHYSTDVLHKDILEIDTLFELEQWLLECFRSIVSLTGEIADQSKCKPVLDAQQYVAVNLDKRISLEEMAEQLYLNPSYFSRLFKRETGETFIEYVTRMKMERAKELLDLTQEPMCVICESLGYDSQSYFIKIFKTYNGVTPVEYRKKKSLMQA